MSHSTPGTVDTGVRPGPSTFADPTPHGYGRILLLHLLSPLAHHGGGGGRNPEGFPLQFSALYREKNLGFLRVFPPPSVGYRKVARWSTQRLCPSSPPLPIGRKGYASNVSDNTKPAKRKGGRRRRQSERERGTSEEDLCCCCCSYFPPLASCLVPHKYCSRGP